MEAAQLSVSTPETGKGGMEGEERGRTDRRIREQREEIDGNETRGVGKIEERREGDQMEKRK